MDYDNVDAKLSFHAKILNGQDTRPFHSSKQPGVTDRLSVTEFPFRLMHLR